MSRAYKISTLFVLVLIAISACIMEHDEDKKFDRTFDRGVVEIDLPEIMEKGKLTVLAENSSTSYFIYKGKKMGFEYEILKLFAQDVGIDLEVKIVTNLDSLISKLNAGEGDIIACNYTITKERQKSIAFSTPLMETKQVLIQRKKADEADNNSLGLPFDYIDEASQLSGKEVHVWKNSSYYQRLLHLQEEIGDSIYIQGVSGQMGGEELIEMVSTGIIDYTIAEENVAQVNARFFENLDASLPLSVKQRIAFGLRKNSPLLASKLNDWLEKFKAKPLYSYIYRKYFEKNKYIASLSSQNTRLDGKNISVYDDIFKKEGKRVGWDWRLLASVAYQESKFNPEIQGFGGAYGMMQFMPNTGPHYGVYPDSPPEVQIKGGASKLAADEKFWSQIKDPLERKKFALASYNAGRGHIQDAQRLAKKYGLNHQKWGDNVEKMLLNLSKQQYCQDEVVRNGMLRGTTTYRYVNDVLERYFEWVSVYE